MSTWDFIEFAMRMTGNAATPKREKETYPMREFAHLEAVVTAQDLLFEDGSTVSVELERPGRVHVVLSKDQDDIRVRSIHRTQQEALDRIEAEMSKQRSERAERMQ